MRRRQTGPGAAGEDNQYRINHQIRIAQILVIGPEGEALPDGIWGELVLTSIGLEAMPLFRYRTGDRGRILTGRCACGSAVKRLETSGRLNLPETSRLDDAVFRCDAVIDAMAENGEVYVLVTGEARKARKELEALLPGAALHIRALEEEDRPFFRGKRNGISR